MLAPVNTLYCRFLKTGVREIREIVPAVRLSYQSPQP